MQISFGRRNQLLVDGKFLTQIHSNRVIVIDNESQDTITMKADAMVTTLHQIKLSIKTADCIPILLYSQNVVAAIHAGWRGAYSGIIQNTIKVMQKLGADEIIAYIGPCIRQNSYEVDEVFYRRFIAQNNDNKRFFHYLHFDLPGYCKSLLNQIGVIKILDEEIDTYAMPNSFYSHRYYLHHNLKLEQHHRQISWITL